MMVYNISYPQVIDVYTKDKQKTYILFEPFGILTLIKYSFEGVFFVENLFFNENLNLFLDDTLTNMNNIYVK